MQLDVISYHDLVNFTALAKLEAALLAKGIVGISDVPEFEKKTRAYINAARVFSALENTIKQQYVPDRDAGRTEGYELGAEWFKDQEGHWQIDDKKASFYAFVPDDPRNKWPQEVDLKTSYQALGQLILATGKLVLKAMGLDERMGLYHDQFVGYGRMLHYHKIGDTANANPNWCGAHFDHGMLTGLVPAYYFQNGKEVDEPNEAGLYITPTNHTHFEKIAASDKSILFFQIGEFGQIISDDRIRATKHLVRKATEGEIERFAFALFCDPDDSIVIKSASQLTADSRYADHQSADGSITYGQWQVASYERYRANSYENKGL
ncbi:MAG: isopenicillin N synthase family oxygenase [Gammaproteobacteria bacterium]|nr:MAG: isopenicillin N synthase family oxygenase [Gammaproteobacteria bacterium]